MEKGKEKEQTNSRRDFLKIGLAVGAGTLLTSALVSAVSRVTAGEKEDTVKVLTSDGRVMEVKKQDLRPVQIDLKEEARQGIPDRKFVMMLDLAKCKNARKCIEACQEGHKLAPDHEWLKVYLLKDSKNAAPYWFPRPCFHCDNPMCVSVCPVGATYKRSDGIVLVDNERCIGCKFCMTGCPYSVRVFHWGKPEIPVDPSLEYSPEKTYPHQEGTVGKCVFCADLLRENKLPRCVTACPMGVIYFGDLVEDAICNGEETIRFSETMRDRSGYRHLEELGTEPSVYYLPPVNRQFPYERGLEGLDDSIRDRYTDELFTNK